MKVKEIIDYLEEKKVRHTCCADYEIEVERCCSLFNLKNNAITWVRYIEDVDPAAFADVENTVLFADINNYAEMDLDVIFVEDVHSVYFSVLDHFFADANPNVMNPDIEETAVVLSTQIGKNVYIGHNTYIDRNVTIGDNVTILHNVVIRGNVIIGDNCLIESLTAIGVTGYGHYVDLDGNMVTAPHLGGVHIGNGVDIGSNVCIERGCLDDTIIEDGAMIDSLSHIGHNAIIKKKAMIVSARIGGSSTVGNNSWVGFGTTVSDQIVIGDNSYVGASTFVNKDVADSKVVVGVPAKVLRDKTEDPKIKRKSKRG